MKRLSTYSSNMQMLHTAMVTHNSYGVIQRHKVNYTAPETQPTEREKRDIKKEKERKKESKSFQILNIYGSQ